MKRPGTLRTLAAAVRDRRVSASHVVGASIERLRAHPNLNVLAHECFEGALRRAEEIDRADKPPTGPLCAVPTLIKDLDDVNGLPTTKGSRALLDSAPARRTGVVPERLVAAGALVVGKSTIPEFAIEGFTANLVTGVTRNPWNEELSPGGSSGGSAAALSAGLVAIATATDGGGSVRIPASLCGLVGLKPTNGVIGRWPAPDWIDYSTDGPFATTSDDLRLLFEVTRGPVAGDPTASPTLATSRWEHGHAAPTRLIAAERTSPFGPLPEEVTSLFADAVSALGERFNLPVTWMSPDEFFSSGDPDLDWFTVTAAEHVAVLGRSWVLAHRDDLHPATQEFLDAGLAVEIDEYLAARRRRYEYVRALDDILAGNAVLLTPSVASPGWCADGRLSPAHTNVALPPEVYSTALQNVTGHPALSVPFGRFASGLPFGLQLTAERYYDLELLDLAEVLEESFPWPRYAPGYEGLESILE